MSDDTSLTVPLSREIEDGLDALAERAQRTKASLAGEAIADFVARELAVVEAIERGLEDVHAGRTVPHEQAMKTIRAVIERRSKVPFVP
ncbi:MAG: CopG family transcriptional regulator [Geminicoccaceae bacterium]|nr:CopG family transcriptional regulator [Geminicoccaceae bacterium]